MSTHRILVAALASAAASTLLSTLTVAPLATAHGNHDDHGRQHEHGRSYSWQITPTGSNEEFRGLAAVNRRTAWVSGEDGSVLRTTDAGASPGAMCHLLAPRVWRCVTSRRSTNSGL